MPYNANTFRPIVEILCLCRNNDRVPEGDILRLQVLVSKEIRRLQVAVDLLCQLVQLKGFDAEQTRQSKNVSSLLITLEARLKGKKTQPMWANNEGMLEGLLVARAQLDTFHKQIEPKLRSQTGIQFKKE